MHSAQWRVIWMALGSPCSSGGAHGWCILSCWSKSITSGLVSMLLDSLGRLVWSPRSPVYKIVGLDTTASCLTRGGASLVLLSWNILRLRIPCGLLHRIFGPDVLAPRLFHTLFFLNETALSCMTTSSFPNGSNPTAPLFYHLTCCLFRSAELSLVLSLLIVCGCRRFSVIGSRVLVRLFSRRWTGLVFILVEGVLLWSRTARNAPGFAFFDFFKIFLASFTALSALPFAWLWCGLLVKCSNPILWKRFRGLVTRTADRCQLSAAQVYRVLQNDSWFSW